MKYTIAGRDSLTRRGDSYSILDWQMGFRSGYDDQPPISETYYHSR